MTVSTLHTKAEKALKQAVIYGTTLASFNVEDFGMAKTASLTLNKVHQRMRDLLKFISYKEY